VKATRKELAEGLLIIGSIGWLVAAFVVPGQWLAGHVRTEATVGMAASTACLLLAPAVDHAARSRLLVGTLCVVGFVSSVYALLVLDASSGNDPVISPNRVRLIVIALLMIAATAFICAVRLHKHRARLVPPNKSLERSRDE
jgi:hypothetical protein